MKLQDEYIFDLPVEEVWNHVFADGAFVSIVPGGEKLTQVAPGEYVAVIPVNMVLFKSDLALKITIAEQKKPEYCRFRGKASGDLGEAHVEGEFRLKDHDGKTLLAYEATVECTGSLGKLAGRMLEKSGKEKIRESLQKIENRITAGTVSGGGENVSPAVS